MTAGARCLQFVHEKVLTNVCDERADDETRQAMVALKQPGVDEVNEVDHDQNLDRASSSDMCLTWQEDFLDDAAS